MLVLVDTNVLLRSVESVHPQHAVARDALRACLDFGHDLCVVPQVHYDFWVVATRRCVQN